MPSNFTEKRTNKWLFPLVFVVILVAILVIFHLISGGIFLEWSNLKGIIAHIAYPSFIAWGFCFLFACGYTDMSIGGVIVLGSFAANVLGNAIGVPGVIIGGLVTGLVLIFINFLVFTYTGIPSWIAGISLALIYEAIALAIKFSDSGPLFTNALNREYRLLGQLPWCVVILAVGLLVVYFLYNRTTIGLNIRSLGGNKEVSRALGINVNKTLLAVGLISGILVGIACFMQQSYAGQTTVKTGLTSINLIFQPLAIYLLAQIIQKRINIVIGVPICAFILYAVFNILTIMGIPSGTLQEACLGIFIVIIAIVGQRKVKGVIK
ncbi:MAG: ABC transporter permease [Oscillospiraceae bacterium]|nr:ABC transporter permease [Oscillospiraceae bacterium]